MYGCPGSITAAYQAAFGDTQRPEESRKRGSILGIVAFRRINGGPTPA